MQRKTGPCNANYDFVLCYSFVFKKKKKNIECCQNTQQLLLTETHEQDRRVDATSASAARVPQQGEKAAGPEGNKLQLTVRGSVRRKEGVWKSH